MESGELNPAGGRWLAVGTSAHSDSRRAGADAATSALTGPDAKLLIVFCSAGHDPAAVLAGIRRGRPADFPLIGCSSGRGDRRRRPRRGHGVVITALGGPGFAVATAAAEGAAASRQREAGAEPPRRARRGSRTADTRR